MQLKIRISTANPGNQSEILQDQGINITVIKEINQRFRLIQFVFHDQRIDRNIDLDFMLVTITHGLLQLLGIAPVVTQSAVMQVAEGILTILGMVGVIADPTTAGLTDSRQALTYTSPRQD